MILTLIIPTIVVLTILGIAVCESRNLYAATTFLLIQGIFSVTVFYPELEAPSLLLSVISLIIIIPLVIYITIKKTKVSSEEPFINGLTSISILLFLIGVFTAYTALNFPNPTTLLVAPLFVVGVYTMLAKADLIKLGLGLALINNATHILTIVIEIPVVVDASLTMVKILTVILVMGLAFGLYNRTKSLDVRKLMLLRW